MESNVGPWIVDNRDGLIHARGIRYAEAGRFEAPTLLPVPTTPTSAIERGPKCPQNSSWFDAAGPLGKELSPSEDCLVLSVTAPEGASSAPVMAWIHGGAYIVGSGQAIKYDPDALARLGVVVVNISYRLGMFGYLSPDPTAGNFGVRDQITALEWIAANIATFGGDPSNVTVFGQSAGGDSICSLLTADGTEGLFRRAILQSPPLGLRHERVKIADAMRERFHALAGTDPAGLSVTQLLEMEPQVREAAKGMGVGSHMPFSPIPGIAPVPAEDAVDDRLRSAASRVELMVGWAKNDAGPFLQMTSVAGRLDHLGPLASPARHVADHALTEVVFSGAITKFVDHWRVLGGKALTYRFDWAPQGSKLGACHCIELPFLFDNDWSDAPMLAGQRPPAELGELLRQTWVDFAENGIHGSPDQHLTFDLEASTAAPR